MHVCFLLPDFHSDAAGGGAESYVSTMADALREKGKRVSVIAFGNRNSDLPLEGLIQVNKPNLHWYVYRGLPFAKSLALPVREVEWSRRAWSALMLLHRTHPVDIVETGETLVLQQLTAGKKPPVVIRGHGNPLASKRFSGVCDGLGDRWGRNLQVMGMKRASAITAVSQFQAKQIATDVSLALNDIHVIPNPISPKLQQQALAQPRVEPSKPVILYTGRIEFRKGSLELLRSVDRVAAEFPEVEYVVAGARHNSIDDRMLNQAFGVNGTRKHVRLIGHVQWQKLADWYRRASVFVMPSYYETFGISVIEAMAFGLPVVASDAGGLPEVVEDGVTGILVPAGDSAALSEALLRLLRDPRLRARMGEAGRERVRSEFTVERIVTQTLEVYQSVLR
jgi:glycosyltransferase involved in cell wall biosynthesis